MKSFLRHLIVSMFYEVAVELDRGCTRVWLEPCWPWLPRLSPGPGEVERRGSFVLTPYRVRCCHS